MSTAVQDAWIADTFAIDPALYSSKPPSATSGAALAEQVAALEKLSAIWLAAEHTVRDQLESLRKALHELYDGDDAKSQMDQDFQVHVDAIFATFDGTLAKDLAAAAAAKSVEDLARAKTALRDLIGAHLDFVAHDGVIGLMDENPFVKLGIGALCQSTLKTLLRNVA